MVSMLLHALALLAIAMAMRDAPRRGAQSERSAEVGIALKHTEGDAEYFETEARPGQAEAKAPAAEPGDLLAELLRERPATDPSEVLPKAPGAIRAGRSSRAAVAAQSAAARRVFKARRA